jgi:hypothetical protein
VSNLSQAKKVNFLKIKLTGTVSNRDGLGALVKVHTRSRALTQYHDGKSGHLAQSAIPLYFGLNDATQVDRVEVRWPSGNKQVVERGLAINTVLDLTEPRQ